ncbi:MAG TPA: zeta toxin family protein [Ramlibacter sp.]|nr:zeta toxin family protein [Ramlibacter sp.]
MRAPSGPTVDFQIAREALRHLLAMRMAQLCVAEREAGPGGADAARQRADVRELSVQLRNLAALDAAAMASVRNACATALKAQLHAAGAARPQPPPAGTLAAQESLRIFEEFIWPALFAGTAPQARPRAVVFGSHLGCAKARAMAKASAALGSPDCVVAVMLEDLRAFHPGYAPMLQHSPRLAAQYTEPDVLRWVDMAVQACLAARVPLVLEAGMRKVEKIVDTFGLLEAAGYEVEARALAVPHAVSWQNTLVAQELSRQELGLTRTNTAAAHQATFDGLPVMLEHIEQQQLAALVTVYDRFGHCCYSHDVRTGRKDGSAPSAATELRIRRALPLTLQHLRQFHQAYRWLEACISAPGREASNDELLQTEGLRWESECALLAEAFLNVPEEQCLAEFPQLGNAFAILHGIRAEAQALDDDLHRTLVIKKAAAGIARRVADGNLAAPIPW